MKIIDYTLSDDIQDYANFEWISAFSDWDKKIKETEENLSKIDLKHIENINNKLLNILDSKFELINYDENLMNDLISYFLYLQIIVQEEDSKLKEEEEKNNKKIQKELVEDIFILQKFDNKIELKNKINELDIYWFEYYFTNSMEESNWIHRKRYLYSEIETKLIFIEQMWLEIFRYIFINANKENRYLIKVLAKAYTGGRREYIRKFDWNLWKFKKYEKYIMSPLKESNSFDYYKNLDRYIKYNEDWKWLKKYSIEQILNSWNSLEFFLSEYYNWENPEKMNKIIEEIEKNIN